MSREPAHWRIVANAYPCDECDAAPGEACITRGGNISHTPHAPRSRAASAGGWANPDIKES